MAAKVLSVDFSSKRGLLTFVTVKELVLLVSILMCLQKSFDNLFF